MYGEDRIRRVVHVLDKVFFFFKKKDRLLS